jgi:GT2 family glycosyltransferase
LKGGCTLILRAVRLHSGGPLILGEIWYNGAYMISIIIPAYNEEKWIGQCLQSIARQEDIDKHEVIVVDNNSSDKTAEIVRTQFPQVRLAEEKQQGLARARNAGAHRATGDILVFFDADNKIPSGWILKLVEFFKKHPEIVGVSGPVSFYDLPRVHKFWEYFWFRFFYPFVNFFLYTVLRKGQIWAGANMAIRRSAFERVGGFNADIVFYGEDADMAAKLARQGKVAFVHNLRVGSSARRILQDPFPPITALRYAIHYAYFLLMGKSRAKTYRIVR